MKPANRLLIAVVAFVFTVTFFGISLTYSIKTQELGSYLTTFVFLCISISFLLTIIQKYKKSNSINIKPVVKLNSLLGATLVFILTFFGISLAYSIKTQELSSYVTTFVFLCTSISLFIMVIQKHKKDD